MDLAEVHETLVHHHHELLHGPPSEVEGLESASCPLHRKHLAQLAMGSAAEGLSAQEWRATIVEGLGPDMTPLVDEAVACMRSAGLWPWD